MKLSLFIILLFLLIAGTVCSSFQNQKAVFGVTSGRITFLSEAPLETIKAVATEMEGVVDINTRNFAFTVKNKSFKGFNSPLQREHFNENYFESDKYPKSTFSGKIIENVNMDNDGNFDVRAKGLLEIHGVQQERIIHCLINIKNHVMNVASDFTVQLQDHNITVPRIVNQKINQSIKVNVQLVLARQ